MADNRPPAREASRRWTRIEDYMVVFGRRRSSPLPPRTTPEEPRFILSTLPFMLLITALFAVGAAMMVVAWPVGNPTPRQQAQPHEQGVAERGWLDDAKKEFRQQADAGK
jgi:hypothetical protein